MWKRAKNYLAVRFSSILESGRRFPRSPFFLEDGQESEGATKPEAELSGATAAASTPPVGRFDRGVEPSTCSYISKGCEIVGTVFFGGSAVIDGKVEGEITGQDKIMVGEEGSVRTSRLSAASIVIAGTAKVKTIEGHRIEILPTGKVWGDLAAPSLIIHEGAQFEGDALIKDTQKGTASPGRQPRARPGHSLPSE